MEGRDDAEDADRPTPPDTPLVDPVLYVSGDIDPGDGTDGGADLLGLLHAERDTSGLPDTERLAQLVSGVPGLELVGLIGGKWSGDNDKIVGVSINTDDDDDATASIGSGRKRGET